MLTRPAACGVDVVTQVCGGPVPYGHGPCELARGAPSVLKSTPDDAVVSLDMIVLLTMFAFNASCSEIPAPSQPATLLVMMLLVTFTAYHCAGVVGKLITSEPRSEEHTSELQSPMYLVCRLLLEKKKPTI